MRAIIDRAAALANEAAARQPPPGDVTKNRRAGSFQRRDLIFELENYFAP
jgi:hypothetical protein